MKKTPTAEPVVMAVDTLLHCYVLACMYRFSCMYRLFGYLLLALGPCYAPTSPASGCACYPLFAGMLPPEREQDHFSTGGGAAFCFHLLFNIHLLCAWGRAGPSFLTAERMQRPPKGDSPFGNPLGPICFLCKADLYLCPATSYGRSGGGLFSLPG